jgi:hypothetical protein
MLEHTLTTRVADASGVEGVVVGGKKKCVDGGDDEEARGEEVAGRSSSESMFELGRKGKNKK